MVYRPHDWPPSPMHSPIDLERRLTKLEDTAEHHEALHEDHKESAGKLKDRMSWHERAILGIIGVIQILAQEKYPALVKLLKGAGP
jgi:hypothetical protein